MNLYIGNLNYNVKESDLRNVMEEYGAVASVKLITDRETRRSKGFAFIEMPDDTEAAVGAPNTPSFVSAESWPDYFLKSKEFISLFIVCGYFFLTFGSLTTNR